MDKKDQFIQDIQAGYTFKGDVIELGGAMYDKETNPGVVVSVPMRSMNRHGLIAGATGSGKTKTLQILAEQLSLQGVPSLLMDIKGDLSGIAMPGQSNPKIEDRHTKIGLPFVPHGSPVEFLSLSGEKGARLRATITEFGPVLFSKILGLNDTQSGIVAVIFKYCDDHKLPLLDLDDFKKTLQYLGGEGKEALQDEYGLVTSASVGAIMRKVIELEQQGADIFFGEPSFDVMDLVRTDEAGRGMVSIVRLTDIQDRPKLFSTFMLQILAEIYAAFPEEGDLDKPKLVLFIDEAHLVFEEASDELLDRIEAIIKLIRSKGIGVFFITQNPADVPAAVLSQLGLKIQHSLRAHTAKDRKAIEIAAENYPITNYYNVPNLITELGIGEAFLTALNEKGIPTPLVHLMLRAPMSRMDVLTDDEIDDIVAGSEMARDYNREINRDSAYEILSEKIEEAQEEKRQEEFRKEREKADKASTRRTSSRSQKSILEKVLTSTTSRQIGRSVAREITRGLLGVLGVKSRRR